MAFLNVQLPELLSNGSVLGPGWDTTVQEMPGGARATNQKWTRPRWQYDIAKSLLTLADNDREVEAIHELIRFFAAVRGAANSWKLWDPIDHSTHRDGRTLPGPSDSADAPLNGVGDGSTTAFQAGKRYTFGSQSVWRPIVLPKLDTLRVWADGVLVDPADYIVGETTGRVTFDTAPGVGVEVRIGCHFYVHAAFTQDVDRWMGVEAAYAVGSISSLPVVEVASSVVWHDFPLAGGAKDWRSTPLTTSHQIDFADGTYQTWIVEAGGSVTLPPIDQVPTSGGPIFILHCDPGSSIGLAVKHGDTGSTLFSMAIGGTLSVALLFESDGSKVWKGWE